MLTDSGKVRIFMPSGTKLSITQRAKILRLCVGRMLDPPISAPEDVALDTVTKLADQRWGWTAQSFTMSMFAA